MEKETRTFTFEFEVPVREKRKDEDERIMYDMPVGVKGALKKYKRWLFERNYKNKEDFEDMLQEFLTFWLLNKVGEQVYPVSPDEV